ncbi:serine/threonine protein kinase [Streptosporangiaceae bacterium NEAU-GS5]|nr:serine/threonine protein kinase [Streptosporangiaceae bacterium NEAU-GS5]
MPNVDAGYRVAGRYELLEPIGRGGMGVVWRAHDTLLDRTVAVKEVLYVPTTDDDKDAFNRRVIREARAAGRIDHPNVVTVHDVIEEDGRPWIVMQLVRARSLGEVIRHHGPLVPDRVAVIGMQVLDALATAHAAGVLHRDIKPENILLSDDVRVVLTDFGIATMPEETSMTMTAGLTGTPAYLPPERLSGQPATPESDLWSLGATLYTAVEGRPPYDRGTPIATMAAVLNGEPDPMRRAGPLAPVIEGLMRRDPVRRIDAVEASGLLRQAAAAPGNAPPPSNHGASYGAPTPPHGQAVIYGQRTTPGGQPPAGTVTLLEGGPPEPPRRSNVGLIVGLSAAGAVLLALAAWYVWFHTLGAGTSATATPAISTAASEQPTAPSHRPSTSPSEKPSKKPSEEPSTEPPSSPPASESPTGPAVALPKGWRLYHDPIGFTVALPRGWTRQVMTAQRVVFRSPGSPSYLQVDLTPWVDPDPENAAKDVESQATAKNLLPGYRRIALDTVNYRGWPAADWEFTWTLSSGITIHVRDRLFSTPDGRQFAIYWHTPDQDWDTTRLYFTQFTQTFQPS